MSKGTVPRIKKNLDATEVPTLVPQPTAAAESSQGLRALIGVDPQTEYRRTIQLFARIGFRRAEATLLSVVEPSVSITLPGGFGFTPAYDVQSDEQVRKWNGERAQRVLDRCGEQLRAEGIRVKEELAYGFPARELLQQAEEISADLIVTGATHHNALSSIVLGSISRAAVIAARQSVLIVKNELPEGKPLSAVFATDLSQYGLSAVEKLISFQPIGLRKVTVMTAVHSGYSQDNSPYPEGNSDTSEAEESREKVLSSRCQEVADMLWKARIRAEPMVIDAAPQQAIDFAMKKTGADLLIMAAHGHGFFERAMIGSLSLHEAVSEEYSLLIIRP